ncbi:MAG: BA14K family protein [Mesorhizobium sp.]|nr:MAG: BA14K family protein [Mesorhizobium sp.]
MGSKPALCPKSLPLAFVPRAEVSSPADLVSVGQRLPTRRNKSDAPSFFAKGTYAKPLRRRPMNRITTGLLAATLSATFVAAEVVPVNAQPAYVPLSQAATPDVQTVQYREWRRNRSFDRNFSRNRSFSRNGDMYWNGHRGYREYHPGYRRHGDYWFPLAAFATGALITGAIVNENNRVYEGNAHVQWCYNHYRSYRASDNTFQPNNGPRRECRSPY